MPTYEYRCASCAHEFELFQQMSDPVKRKCPKCGKPKLERLIGAGAGVIFKGGGFYQTDYRSDSYKKSAEADKKSSTSEPASKDSASTDGKAKETSKPETKSASESSADSAPRKKPASRKKSKGE
jgi:putative FmdB family regulatory protein